MEGKPTSLCLGGLSQRRAHLMDSQNENLDIGRMGGIDISKMDEVTVSDKLAEMNVETENDERFKLLSYNSHGCG